MYCFIYFLCIVGFELLSLDVVDFDNLQDLEDQDFGQQQAEEKGK
jgi:hypothetical protein